MIVFEALWVCLMYEKWYINKVALPYLRWNVKIKDVLTAYNLQGTSTLFLYVITMTRVKKGFCNWFFKENAQTFMLEHELINVDALILRYVYFFFYHDHARCLAPLLLHSWIDLPMEVYIKRAPYLGLIHPSTSPTGSTYRLSPLPKAWRHYPFHCHGTPTTNSPNVGCDHIGTAPSVLTTTKGSGGRSQLKVIRFPPISLDRSWPCRISAELWLTAPQVSLCMGAPWPCPARGRLGCVPLFGFQTSGFR